MYFKDLEEEVEKQSERIGELGNVLMVMGRYEERMGALRRDMDDLKRGRGYIKDWLWGVLKWVRGWTDTGKYGRSPSSP